MKGEWCNVKIKIEPGTQPGKTLRLRGKGLPAVQGYGSGTGDLVVHISIYVPKELNKEEKKIIEELRQSENFRGDNSTKRSIFENFKKLFCWTSRQVNKLTSKQVKWVEEVDEWTSLRVNKLYELTSEQV